MQLDLFRIIKQSISSISSELNICIFLLFSIFFMCNIVTMLYKKVRVYLYFEYIQ